MSMDANDAYDRFLACKTTRDVDRAIMQLLTANGAPDYIRLAHWKWVMIAEAGVDGAHHTLEVLVPPTPLAFGADGAVFHASRSTPYGAQAAVEVYNSILPSMHILRKLQAASKPKIDLIDMKLAPYNFQVDGKNHGGKANGKSIETPECCVMSSTAANDAFAAHGVDAGEGLVYGYKKGIVVGPNLDGSHVAIYGGLGGGQDKPYNVWQPYSTIHASDYSDYSHSIVYVHRKARLDGHLVDLRYEVFGSKDPQVYSLATGSQGRFDPVFPNAGGSSKAAFSVGGTPPAPQTFAPDADVAVNVGAGGVGTLVKLLGGALALYAAVRIFT